MLARHVNIREVKQMKANGEKVPHLAAIIVGNDGASLTYVGSKVKACERVGFESTLVKMPSTTSETELLKKIKVFCGTGGTLIDSNIHLQGDMVSKSIEFLRKEGFHNL